VPRTDGSVVVGATVEEKGFDLSVQAGALGDLLDDARRLVPSLEEYTVADTTTGLRPGSPDNAPIVGYGGIPGLVVATGAYRNGILQAPLTAREVLRLVVGGTDAGDAGPFAPFRPARFAAHEAGPVAADAAAADDAAAGLPATAGVGGTGPR
jgi:glycine oxidase